jgi:hypothetical protein
VHNFFSYSVTAGLLLLLALFVSAVASIVTFDKQPNDSLYYNSLYATAVTSNTVSTQINNNISNNMNSSDSDAANANLSIITSNMKLPSFSSASYLNSSTVNNAGQENANFGNGTASFGLYEGTLKIPYTGLTRHSITPEISRAFGLNKTTYAMLVTEVSPGSPAQKAGIEGGNMTRSISGEIMKIGGDIILKVDGNATFVTNNEAFLNYLQNEKKVGDNITFTILRDGLIGDIQMALGAMPNFFWYDNPDEGIRIKHPSDWGVIERHLEKDDIVKFFSPERTVVNGNSTPPTAGVFVKIFPSNDVGLDTMASEAVQDTESTRNLEMSLLDLSGLPAYERVYYEYSDRPLKVMSVFTIKDGQVYRINFASDPDKYDDYLSLAKEIMNSFEFTK